MQQYVLAFHNKITKEPSLSGRILMWLACYTYPSIAWLSETKAGGNTSDIISVENVVEAFADEQKSLMPVSFIVEDGGFLVFFGMFLSELG